VGALAVALGIGTAVAAGLAAPASADTTGSTGSTDSATSAPARKASSARIRSTAPTIKQPARRVGARGTSKPSAPVAASTAWGLLAAAGRELDRTFFNQYPTTNPSITTQSPDGVVTGTLGATDPDGDRLVYTVVGNPSLGRVSIDQATGDFTYRPVVDFASYGGTDAFTVSVIA
jgi:hypothetical protein